MGVEVIDDETEQGIVQKSEVNELKQKTATNILEAIHKQPEKAIELILQATHIKSKTHLIYDLIEEGVYGQSEETLFQLARTKHDVAHMHDHIIAIKKKFMEHTDVYTEDQITVYMNRLMTTFFPNHTDPQLEDAIKTITTRKK